MPHEKVTVKKEIDLIEVRNFFAFLTKNLLCLFKLKIKKQKLDEKSENEALETEIEIVNEDSAVAKQSEQVFLII